MSSQVRVMLPPGSSIPKSCDSCDAKLYILYSQANLTRCPRTQRRRHWNW